MASRRRIRCQQSDQHHRRSDKRVQRQLHRRILAPRRSPDRDQEVLRHDRNLIKHKQQEQIEAEKHSIHAANQRQKESEELIRPQFDVPAEQHAGHRSQSRQQHQHAADPVSRQREANAHRCHPRHIDQRHATLPRALREPGNTQSQIPSLPPQAQTIALTLRYLSAAAPTPAHRQTRCKSSKPTSISKSPMRQQILNRGIHSSHNQLRHHAEQEHQSDHGRHPRPLPAMQIGKFRPTLRDRPGKHLLNHRQNHRRRHQQSKH